MSVVTHQARRRWAIVAAGIAVLLCLPTAASAATALVDGRDDAATPAPRTLLQRALASADVPHSGLAQSTGTLGLPELPQLADTAAALGGSTRTRVWWAGPQSWRVDVLTPTGEQGIYADRGRNVLWDDEQSRLTEVIGTSPVRLPRADDLIPPQAARRLLAGVGPADRVEALPGHRSVAGVRAEGVRVVPADRRSTIGHVDVWVDPDHGLPGSIDLVDTRGVTALTARFLELDLAAPAAGRVAVPTAPGAEHGSTDAPDLATRIQRFSGRRLPDLPERLAGVELSAPIVGGTATYGSGLVRFVVLPLPGRLADQVLDTARTGGGTAVTLTGGEGMQVSSGLINLLVCRTADGRRSFLVAGLVTADVLAAAGQDLLARPTPQTFG